MLWDPRHQMFQLSREWRSSQVSLSRRAWEARDCSLLRIAFRFCHSRSRTSSLGSFALSFRTISRSCLASSQPSTTCGVRGSLGGGRPAYVWNDLRPRTVARYSSGETLLGPGYLAHSLFDGAGRLGWRPAEVWRGVVLAGITLLWAGVAGGGQPLLSGLAVGELSREATGFALRFLGNLISPGFGVMFAVSGGGWLTIGW